MTHEGTTDEVMLGTCVGDVSPDTSAAVRPDRVAVIQDVNLALEPVERQATAADEREVRQRLRDDIGALAIEADAYAHSLGDSRAREIAIGAVRHAREVAREQGHNLNVHLRLLAKSTQMVARYAAAHQQQSRTCTLGVVPGEGASNLAGPVSALRGEAAELFSAQPVAPVATPEMGIESDTY
ncbi:hypothetical protein ABT039_09675 [Streptomyces lasiicapitis]|uniref:hypothetical protein n=1 Tax=Streptomyces lasiicapitis TaxID=1923961 RepID=UPI0033323DAD